jgi:hypothetical protein
MTSFFVLRYEAGGGAGTHMPALLASMVLWVIAVGLFVSSMLAAGIDTSRKLLEEALYSMRRLELNRPDA